MDRKREKLSPIDFPVFKEKFDLLFIGIGFLLMAFLLFGGFF